MRRRDAFAGSLVALAVLVAAPAAHGQGAVVQAADGPPGAPLDYRWLPDMVTIKAGETVTWRFEGATGSHNLKSRGGNWNYYSGPWQVAHPPVSLPFSTPGEYVFECEVHASTMFGKVVVTDASGTPPPPPPPPPLSEQPFPNDQTAPQIDNRRPTLSNVRATARRRGARVRFRLSEPARVKVKVTRSGVTVARRSVTRRRGAHSVVVGGLAGGRYRIEVRAIDLAGNVSRVRRARLSV